MANEYKKINLKLDGIKTISIPLVIKKNGFITNDLFNIVGKGYIKFIEETEEQAKINATKKNIYPVLFSSVTTTINNGKCIITIMPRAEDIFEDVSTLSQRSSVVTSVNSLLTLGNIDPTQLLTKEANPAVIIIKPNEIRYPYKLSLEFSIYSVNDLSIFSKTVNRGTNPVYNKPSDLSKILYKYQTRQSSNLIIDCYSDIEWIPSVTKILYNNNSSYDDIMFEVEKLSNFVSFGSSTLYDSVTSAARILSDNSISNNRKIIYLFSDNESNVSQASLQDCLTEVNDIDGEKNVPIVIGNVNTSEPVSVSTIINRSDTRDINALSYLTGGQSITISSDNSLDEIAGIFYREAVGSLGYGTYEFTVDMNEEVVINSISSIFHIPDNNCTASWYLLFSTDGYEYTDISKQYSYDENVEFENLKARYIKFKIVLISGIDTNIDAYREYLESPALTSVVIIYNAYKIVYLYMNKEECDYAPYHMTLAVDANEINSEQIETGVTSSNSYSWIDFSTPSKPSVDQNGKTVFPIRFSNNIEEFTNEPLTKIDNFTLETNYDRWDPYDIVFIYDENDSLISSDLYRIDSRKNLIIFNYLLPDKYKTGDYKIGILKNGIYKIGLKLSNKTKDQILNLYGISFMYSTEKNLLPPLSKSKPEARSVTIIDSSPNRFSVIECSYTYFDENYQTENLSGLQIRWYINGKRITYLDNLKKWNDINDPLDPIYLNTGIVYPQTLESGDTLLTWIKKQNKSILYANDSLYCEILVSDGSLYSDATKSLIVVIKESSPIMNAITIVGQDYNNTISTRLSPDMKAVFYPSIADSFYSDSGENVSEIIWYVNGEEFKKGNYGQSVASGQPPIHEIWVNEFGSTSTFRDYALRIGNSITAEVVPKTLSVSGDSVFTPSVVVQNTLPTVFNLKFLDSVHPISSDIIMTWEFYDFEISSLSGIDNTGQSDQSSVKVYRKMPGTGTSFELVYIYNDIENDLASTFYVSDYSSYIVVNASMKNITIRKNILLSSQQWYISIIPYDTIDKGIEVRSSTITITASTN